MSIATMSNKKPARGRAGGPLRATAAVPRLLNGDHLTVPEFERRYEATPEVKFDEKKAVYQRAQVREYFVWQVMDAQIHWFTLEEGQYAELKPRPDGVICSRVFPGLWLDIPALLAGDEEEVLRVLDKGLKSLEHGAFVRKTGKR